MSIVTIQGKPFHTLGEPPAVGTKAPDFKLTTTDLQSIQLKDFKDTPLLISTIPSLDTEICFSCTKKLEEISLKYPGVGVLIVTLDLPPTLKRICRASNYQNVLLFSDFNFQSFGKKYGVKIKDGVLKGFLSRAFFILDKNHQVIHSEVLKKIDAMPKLDKLEEIIKQLAP